MHIELCCIMYFNVPKNQKYVIFQTFSGYGPQRTAVHGYASHPLWDVIRKPRAGYRPKENYVFEIDITPKSYTKNLKRH